jgi:hypothetical protein
VSPLPNTRPKNVLSFAYQCTLYAESESASNKIVLNIYLCIYKLYSKYFSASEESYKSKWLHLSTSSSVSRVTRFGDFRHLGGC